MVYLTQRYFSEQNHGAPVEIKTLIDNFFLKITPQQIKSQLSYLTKLNLVKVYNNNTVENVNIFKTQFVIGSQLLDINYKELTQVKSYQKLRYLLTEKLYEIEFNQNGISREQFSKEYNISKSTCRKYEKKYNTKKLNYVEIKKENRKAHVRKTYNIKDKLQNNYIGNALKEYVNENKCYDINDSDKIHITNKVLNNPLKYINFENLNLFKTKLHRKKVYNKIWHPVLQDYYYREQFIENTPFLYEEVKNMLECYINEYYTLHNEVPYDSIDFMNNMLLKEETFDFTDFKSRQQYYARINSIGKECLTTLFQKEYNERVKQYPNFRTRYFTYYKDDYRFLILNHGIENQLRYTPFNTNRINPATYLRVYLSEVNRQRNKLSDWETIADNVKFLLETINEKTDGKWLKSIIRNKDIDSRLLILINLLPGKKNLDKEINHVIMLSFNEIKPVLKVQYKNSYSLPKSIGVFFKVNIRKTFFNSALQCIKKGLMNTKNIDNLMSRLVA